jgi:hypothetical protein
MAKNGNPQQFMQSIMGNSQIMQNPMAKNTIEMAQKGDMNGIEQMARNLCKEKGINADEIYNSYKQKFGM